MEYEVVDPSGSGSEGSFISNGVSGFLGSIAITDIGTPPTDWV